MQHLRKIRDQFLPFFALYFDWITSGWGGGVGRHQKVYVRQENMNG